MAYQLLHPMMVTGNSAARYTPIPAKKVIDHEVKLHSSIAMHKLGRIAKVECCHLWGHSKKFPCNTQVDRVFFHTHNLLRPEQSI
jgi:hypothetical protein